MSVGLFEGSSKPLDVSLNCVGFLNKVFDFFGNEVSDFTDRETRLINQAQLFFFFSSNLGLDLLLSFFNLSWNTL